MENEEDNTVSLLSNDDYNQASHNNGAPTESPEAAYNLSEYLSQNQAPTQTQTQTPTQTQTQTQTHTQTHTHTHTQTQPSNIGTGRSFEGAAFSTPVTFPIVEVVAPATLATGYTFDAMVDGRVLTIVVPRPGVTEGQVFEAQTQAPWAEDSELIKVPEGFWKDGLWDFCRFGPVHPSLLLSCCCPLVALGQIATRLGLRWDGEQISASSNVKRTFQIFVVLSMCEIFIPRMFKWIFLTFVVLVTARVRSHMRARYSLPPTMLKTIPNDNPRCSFPEERYVVEDYCLPVLCLPCTISQMSRHTAMYETYEGKFMSTTGLPDHVPLMV